MGFRINTNVGAMNAHMYSTKNNVGLDKSLSHLSSGLRINKAADDAAGLAIADSLRSQASGLGQSIRNANDGIGLVQTADGALEEVSNILNRMRTLAVQSSNDTQSSTSRGFIQDEINVLLVNIENIASQTKFNGQTLLDGSFSGKLFHIGAYSGETVSLSIASADTAGLAVTAGNVGMSTQADAEDAISAIDAALDTLNGIRSLLGATQNQLESVVRNISVTQVNVTAAESQIRDVDFAAESASFNKHNIMAQSGSYAMSQANAVQQNVLRLLQ
ncbi:MAG: flagellin [Sulfuricurvum sp.]|nr:flagellin [Sulfuricurvum sp.]